jgi:hypothetical protein
LPASDKGSLNGGLFRFLAVKSTPYRIIIYLS